MPKRKSSSTATSWPKAAPFFAIGAIDISDDGRWLAYTVDYTGFRQYSLYIKDLETGELLPGTVERVGSVVWAADNSTLFYTVEDDEQKRQFQLYRHMRGTPYAADVLVYQDDDERFNIGAGRTRDGKYIVMESASHTASEAWVLPAAEPEGEFKLICPAPGRARILRRSSQRAVVHPHQRPGTQFPPRHRAGGRSRARELDRAHPPPPDVMLEEVDSSALSTSRANAKTACRAAHLAVCRKHRGRRAAGRNRISRAGLQRSPPHQPHLRFNRVPLRLPIAGLAQFGL